VCTVFIIYKGIRSEFIMEIFSPSNRSLVREKLKRSPSWFQAWRMNGKKKREIARQKLEDSKSERGLEMKKVYESGSRKSFLLLL